ncbi:MAG: insulinase family protein [Chloroflexota bacterium]|nr:insulinase family protein [Chloroflexota bacterium]
MKHFVPAALILLMLLAGCVPVLQPSFPPLLVATSDEPPSSQPLEANLLPFDPQVRTGQLDNGLAYFIRHNEEPKERAELWLAIDAGSILENEDQKGLAHLLEHMLFNGTRRFPKTQLVGFLQSLGIEFGPDVNAYTSFDETVYMLHIPTDDALIVQSALDVLEDWAAYALLDAEEIDKERGVVVEEWRLRDQNASGRILEQIWPVLLEDSLYAERLPIGDMDIIRESPPEATRRFFETWYRPDLMAIIAVGDFDADLMEARIQDRFSQLPPAPAGEPRRYYQVPAMDRTRFLVISDPENTTTSVSIENMHPARVDRTTGDFQESLVEALFSELLNLRLAEIARQADAPFLYAFGSSGNVVRPVDSYTLEAGVEDDGVVEGLEALLTEIERIRRHGFADTELERARTSFSRIIETIYNERENYDNASHASELLDHFLTGSPVINADAWYQLLTQLMPGITLAEINKKASDLVSDSNQVVIVTAPEKEGLILPAETELSLLFETVQAAAIAPYIDEVVTDPLMARIPAPGKIVAGHSIPELGVTEFQLANGIQVIIKPTDFREDQVLVSAISPGGTSLVADEDYLAASYSSLLVSQSGVGDFDQTALQKLLSDKLVGVSPRVFDLYEGLSGASSPNDLETLFQLITLYATEARIDENAFEVFRTNQREWLENRSLSPYDAFSDAIRQALYGTDDIRYRVPTLEEIDTLDRERALELYQERFADMGDFTFTIVGNIDEDRVKELARTYLATLPSQGREETWRDLAPDLPGGIVEKKVFRGQEDQSIAQLFFTGTIEATRENALKLDVLADLLNILAIDELREERSAVYAVDIWSTVSDEPDETYQVGAWFSTDPDRVDELVDALFDLIRDIQENGPSQEALNKVKEQQRRDREEAVQTNAFWLSQLEDAFTDPEADPLDILAFEDALEALTIEDIQAAANAYLSEDSFIQVVLYPEALEETAPR